MEMSIYKIENTHSEILLQRTKRIKEDLTFAKN